MTRADVHYLLESVPLAPPREVAMCTRGERGENTAESIFVLASRR